MKGSKRDNTLKNRRLWLLLLLFLLFLFLVPVLVLHDGTFS